MSDERCDCGTIWCRLDNLTHCKIRVVCDWHDRQILGQDVTFHDATAEIAQALADPEMAARVAAVRAEMDACDEAEAAP